MEYVHTDNFPFNMSQTEFKKYFCVVSIQKETVSTVKFHSIGNHMKMHLSYCRWRQKEGKGSKGGGGRGKGEEEGGLVCLSPGLPETRLFTYTTAASQTAVAFVSSN